MRSLAFTCLTALLFGATTTPAHNLGWAVGEAGAILHSDTSGSIWRAQTSGTTADLNGVDFSRWLTGVAVGDAGAVVFTTDGGATWLVGNSETSRDLHAVAVLDKRRVVVVGSQGAILTTNWGGEYWFEWASSGTTASLNGVDFVDTERGWAVGADGTILHSTNGGEDWVTQVSGTSQWLSDVDFVDADTGWAVGAAGTILHTSDGGTTWSPQTSGTSGSLNAVDFVDVNQGWAVERWDAVLLRTVDGGDTWFVETLPDAGIYGLNDIEFASRDIGSIVGTAASPGATLDSRNGGSSWNQRSIPVPVDLESLAFVTHADHFPNADPCRSQCAIDTSSCEERPRSEFRDYQDELPHIIGACSSSYVDVIEGSCAGGQVLFLEQHWGIFGDTKYYDAATQQFTGITSFTDIGYTPCSSGAHWPAPITCPNAIVTAVHCGSYYTIGDPVYHPPNGTIPVEGAFVYPEDIPVLPTAGGVLLVAGITAAAARRLRRRSRDPT